MRKSLQILIFLITIWLIPEKTEAKNILLLNSYHRGLNWSDEIFNGIKQVTDQYDNINLFTEYIDAKRFPDTVYLESLINLYTQKYKGYTIDAVICADNTALDLVIKHAGNPLFKGFKVYCGVNNIEDYQHLGSDYKGVAEREFFMERFDLFKRMVPNLETVYFLMDKSEFGVTYRNRLEKVIQSPPYKVNIKIINDIDVNELYAFVSSLKEKKCIIDYGSITRDRYGEIVNNEKLALNILRFSQVPVFSNFDFLKGKGIVGGICELGSDQGITAAKIAMRLLSGEPSANVPKVSLAPKRFNVDYSVAKKFNLQLNNLPKETIILNRPEKIYQRYLPEISITISAIIILVIIIIILLSNIQKRKLTELSLTQSEQKFRDIAELLPQTVFECDLQGNLTFANKQAFDMFGYTIEEFNKGINIRQLFIPEESEHINSNLKVILSNGPSKNNSYNAVRKDGSRFPYEVHSNIFYKDGKPAGVRGIGIDVTKQKEVERALINAREKAEQSDKLKSAFLSNMSHEIRTPLNAIIGFSSLLADDDASSEQRAEYKKYIQNSSEYLLNLINDIIDHSRIEAGQLDILYTEFNLYDLMKELYLNFKSQQKKQA